MELFGDFSACWVVMTGRGLVKCLGETYMRGNCIKVAISSGDSLFLRIYILSSSIVWDENITCVWVSLDWVGWVFLVCCEQLHAEVILDMAAVGFLTRESNFGSLLFWENTDLFGIHEHTNQNITALIYPIHSPNYLHLKYFQTCFLHPSVGGQLCWILEEEDSLAGHIVVHVTQWFWPLCVYICVCVCGGGS